MPDVVTAAIITADATKHDGNFGAETTLTLWSRRILRNDTSYLAMVCYPHFIYLNLGMTSPPV